MPVLRFTFFLLMMLLPGLALAKRGAPPKVTPVISQGVRYVTPNDNCTCAYIEAWDIQTEKKLWNLTVFTNRINPKLEQDVQCVFIEKMSLKSGDLIVTSEDGSTYKVDLKKKVATRTR